MFSINFQGNQVGLHNGLTVALAGLFVLLSSSVAFGQSTTFTYQGRLQDTGTNANGSYDLQFTLWDAVSGGTQQPQPPVTVTRTAVQVVNGLFTTSLDFGANAFPGAGRWLETSVRLTGNGQFTILSPRQQITAAPYAIHSASSSSADTATTAATATNATNSSQLGGVAASNYVQTSDSRLSDSRAPTPNSSFYIQNTTSLQAGNFNINGSGVVGGNLSAGTLSGNGSGLTNLNATNITSGTITNARLGTVPIANGGTGITSSPTAAGQYLRSSGAGTWALGSVQTGDLPSLPYVAKSGDTMTGALSLPANGLVAGNNQLVLSGGNVGIGTTNPGDKLTVNGNSTIAKAQSSGSTTYALAYDEGSGFVGFQKRGTTQPGLTSMGLGNNASEILSTSGNLGLYTYNSGYLALGTNGIERLRVDASGNVGIFGIVSLASLPHADSGSNPQLCRNSLNQISDCMAPIPKPQTDVLTEQQARIQQQQKLIEAQQEQLDRQQQQLDALKKLVCLSNRRASVCR